MDIDFWKLLKIFTNIFEKFTILPLKLNLKAKQLKLAELNYNKRVFLIFQTILFAIFVFSAFVELLVFIFILDQKNVKLDKIFFVIFIILMGSILLPANMLFTFQTWKLVNMLNPNCGYRKQT